MNCRIISDSASNLYALEDVDFVSVPLKIVNDQREYVDAPGLDVPEMIENLRRSKGTSRTSCPNTYEWLRALEGCDAAFLVTISSALSGSYSAATQAREEYLRTHPDAKICAIDSLSTGSEMQLIIEKLRDCILRGMEFSEIETEVRRYHRHTHILFCLESLNNLARNGRVNPTIAKIAGVLGIRVLGEGSEEGQLRILHKCRGEKRVLETFLAEMRRAGFGGGRAHIAHCLNLELATRLREMILRDYPACEVSTGSCTGLCSYYAEKGGLIVGYEDAGAL